MKAKTHLFSGIFLATLLLTLFNLSIEQELLLLVFTVVGAIMPDFDMAVAWLAPKNVPFFHWFFKHRGMSHSIYPWLLCGIAVHGFVVP